ncbi:MAG: DEAD/DEAH box helicase family protein [Polaribacter sp.]|nr:DEAD/DEAH box helicase family protein [Polaribacter sp.]
MAKEASDKGDRQNQIFVHSGMEETALTFKSQNKEKVSIKHDKSLHNVTLPKDNDLVVHTTYNQILNLSHEKLTTFDYVFIDESHALTNDIEFRADTIAQLIYHLVEFVAKNPHTKTKIIFMSGTPNVETKVLLDIMRDNDIDDLFQRIIVDKEYKVTPSINLTHLDSSIKSEREDSVINQINNYLKEDRKVCYIFNNKEKMDEMKRLIQTKLSNKIKVGLFYSGSTGECTENIISGKFGDFDVVLTTNYFINGINIDGDGLTDNDKKAGKTSTQKYAVVLDLGLKYSCISSMDTIQTINRFRNRLCHCTVFFPKIFKPDEDKPSRKFHFGNAAKVLLGINKYNYHLLSVNENAAANQFEEKDNAEKLHLLNEFRKNPLKVSLVDIAAATKKEEHKNIVTSKITQESRLYKDWFYSLDGYYYLSKDAGFDLEIMNKDLGEPLKELTEDQVELENIIIRKFIENKDVIQKIFEKLEVGKKIIIKASDTVLDPLSIRVDNFSVEDINNTYIFVGDFHSSHERALNKLIRCCSTLSFLYNANEANKSLEYLINPEIDFLPTRHKSVLKYITTYVKSCRAFQSKNSLDALNYIKTLDYLSRLNIGIVKETKPTFNSYTIINEKLVEVLKNMWAKNQLKTINYKISLFTQNNQWSMLGQNNSNLLDRSIHSYNFFEQEFENTFINHHEKKAFKKYFSNKELIRQHDLEKLEKQLKYISNYKKLSYTNDRNLKSLETIIVPKIMRSPKLLLPLETERNEFMLPRKSTLKNIDDKFDKLIDDLLKKLETFLTKAVATNNALLEFMSSFSINMLKCKDVFGLIQYLETFIKNPNTGKTVDLLTMITTIQNDLKKIDKIILSAFKTSEYTTYKNLNDQIVSPFDDEIFFCDKNFKLESLNQKTTFNLNNIKKSDIFDSLRKNSALYKDTKKIRPRSSSGSRPTVNMSNIITTAFVVIDKNNMLLFADFSKSKACKFLCDYAYKKESFKLKDGTIPIKKSNKGIYNPATFRLEYYPKKSINKTVDNYSIEELNVDIKKYKDYVDSL